MDNKFIRDMTRKGGVSLVDKSGKKVDLTSERRKEMKKKAKKKTQGFNENMTKVNKIMGGY